ncbi:hypothetical protein DH2020_025324 [Rehmannia glutinosa]|uniref:tRNA (adenine(58)-N(1))-methyltransferase non-catalytic subunit TRM6 n=1 Tax=Rehmannia glutinosa TaxID=99300 RepID=A0ABR0W004_REHGL
MSTKSSEEILSANQNPRITWEGCSVLLDINDGDRVLFARLTAGSKVKIGNKNCSLQPLIGCPFGSSFQVEVGEEGPFLSRVVPSTEGNNLGEKMDCQNMEECRDNRTLVDNNTAQSLTSEDIDDMRRKGATGDEIVEALIANSSTFEKKTAFSQEKYRIKKQKKYAPGVLLRRPFARRIVHASLAELQPSHSETSTSIDQLEDACDKESSPASDLVNMEESSNVNLETVSNLAASPKTNKSIKAGEKAPLEAIKSWKENGFSSLIIAAPDLDAWSIVKELVPLLSYSAPFVIYHQYLQPLATCMHNLQTEKMAIDMQISEPWLREYQVLPSRTHPHMQMSSSGGYLLSGIRITAIDQPQPN